MADLAAGVELISHGGFMMYPLLGAALVALTVIFERAFVFQRRLITPSEHIRGILDDARRQRLGDALNKSRGLHTPIGAVLTSGLEHFAHSQQEMELAMKNAAEQWVPIVERRISVLDTIVTGAPLMGLLGTITGMMSAFRVLSEKGVNEPHAITGGVAEALIATATGLVIALVSMFAYNYFAEKAKALIYEVESASSQLVEARLASSRTGSSK